MRWFCIVLGFVLPVAFAQTRATSAAVNLGSTLVSQQLAATVTCPSSFKAEFDKGVTTDYLSCFAWTGGFAPGDVDLLEGFTDTALEQNTAGYEKSNGWDNTPPSATNAYYFADGSVLAMVIVLNAGYVVLGSVQ